MVFSQFSFRVRILVVFFFLFTIFAATIAIFQFYYEKELRSNQLKEKLLGYGEMVATCLDQEDCSLEETVRLMPEELRVTVVGTSGNVIFDNSANEVGMENHINRPEIQEAAQYGSGSAIRYSQTLNSEFFYFARKYDQRYIRTAYPFTASVASVLKPEKLFFILIGGLFLLFLILVFFVSTRLGKSIKKLSDFSLEKDPKLYEEFPEGELGNIGRRIVELHKRNQRSSEKVQLEREKLIKHFQNAEGGIAIFSREQKVIFQNARFVQYAKLIFAETVEDSGILTDKSLKPLQKLLQQKEPNSFEKKLETSGKTFHIKGVVFDDLSFELLINDITSLEKNIALRRELTQNISHELKTPVTTILGYLDIISEIDIDAEKQKYFVGKARHQVERLSNLIHDISVINQTEVATHVFQTEPLEMHHIVHEICDLSKLPITSAIPKETIINGNRQLIESIFENLISNSNKYAGNYAEISIECYMEDEDFVYFSYSDTGKGIPDKHLSRIFERFYRADEGRDRSKGGTGLGLSIVKNAVLAHGGHIEVKNQLDGGLEFLFTLKK